jgi:hypothetical protein
MSTASAQIAQIRQEALDMFRNLPVGAIRRSRRLGRWESMADGVTVADGEAGRGVYFFSAGDTGMSDHYRERGWRRLVEIDIADDDVLVDYTHPRLVGRVCRLLTRYAAACGSVRVWHRNDFQRSFWGLTFLSEVMAEVLPQAVGYIVPHVIPSCSPSRQISVTREEACLSALAA